MKKPNQIRVLIVVLLIVPCIYAQTIESPYEVGHWLGFKPAAISYTFDDGCANQFTTAIPMFNEYDFDMTLFTVTNWTTDWDLLRDAAAQGHEVASHTVTHPSLSGQSLSQQRTELRDSQQVVNDEIPGEQCVTLAYPYCATAKQSLTSEYYLAARACQGKIESSTPNNFYNISSIICGDQGSVNSAEDFYNSFEATEDANGWCVFLLHGIDDDGGYSPLSSATLRDSLDYLDARRDAFWVTTFAQAARYARQRSNLTLMETSITLKITDGLNDTLFNQPISIRRPLPEHWDAAYVTQGGVPVDANIVDSNSVNYVTFDVVPDGGDVVLARSPVAPEQLTTTIVDGAVILDWADCNEVLGLLGYHVYRSTSSDSGFSLLNDSLLIESTFVDEQLAARTNYYYKVTSMDRFGNESPSSPEVYVELSSNSRR